MTNCCRIKLAEKQNFGFRFRFKENAVDLSRRFHDRPVGPRETVAYWTEYVLRHDGAHHLKSHAVSTEWYQYFSLDFLALALVSVGSPLYLLYRVVRSSRKSRPEDPVRKAAPRKLFQQHNA